MTVSAHVITCSDAASRGERVDTSGPAVAAILQNAAYEVAPVEIVPDELDAIASAIRRAVERGATLVVTTGGTGIAPRDVTPEATAVACDRLIPGFGELMRLRSMESTPMAALSRATAGSLGRALVVNLPGSETGASENLNHVLRLLPHALELLGGGRVERHPR